MEQGCHRSSTSIKIGGFRFNASHFTCFANEREKLHGHNYQLEITIKGKVKIKNNIHP